MPRAKHDYQSNAVTKAAQYYKTKNRGKIVWPCGMGKSLLGVWCDQEAIAIDKAVGARTTLVLVPSLALVQQTLRVWAGELAGQEVEWLCVCSDKSVGKGDDQWQVDPAELGIQVTTDQAEVAEFLGKRTKAKRVVFSTYQSGDVLAAGAKGKRFDFGIYDEAHKTAGNAGLFSLLLHDENVRIRKRLFMTATERFYKGSKDTVLSMDDESVYGETIDTITFKQAIEMGIESDQTDSPHGLSDYRIVTMTVTSAEIEKLVKQNPQVLCEKTGVAADARAIAAAIALRKTMDEHGLKRAITFHNSIERAEQFSDIQNRLTACDLFGSVTALHINGSEHGSVRSDKMAQFVAADRCVISNAKCLTEGVDVPSVDCVLFADPKGATVDIVQAAGRALRMHPGKRMAYIIVPVVVDAEADELAVGDATFHTVLSVIRAMGSVDQRIVEQFRDHRDDGSRGDRPQVVQFGALSHDQLTLTGIDEQVRLKYWGRLKRLVPFLSYEEAVSLIRNLRINTASQYRAASRLHACLPSNPNEHFAGRGWVSWAAFLGKRGRVASAENVLSYAAASKLARSLGVQSQREYKEIRRLHTRLPARPNVEYFGKGWVDWYEFLGSRKLDYETAKRLVQTNGIRSRSQYKLFQKTHPRLPAVPHKFYVGRGWVGEPEFYGNDRPVFLSYDEAKTAVQRNGVKSREDYKRRRKSIDTRLPSAPPSTYSSEWTGWSDFLGTERPANRKSPCPA